MKNNIIVFVFVFVALVQVNMKYIGCRLSLDISNYSGYEKYIVKVNNENITTLSGNVSWWSGECFMCTKNNNNVDVIGIKGTEEIVLKDVNYKVYNCKSVTNIEAHMND